MPGIRYIVPEGTKYRVTSVEPPDDEKKKGSRGQRAQAVIGFILRTRVDDDHEMPVVPDSRYMPLYEGRMVHQFDHAFNGYVSGEGNSQKWRDLSMPEKKLIPHYYVEQPLPPPPLRAGYRRVNNQANERTMLSSVVPEGHVAGDTVTIATITGPPECRLVMPALGNSFMVDFLLRQKIYATMNYFFVVTTPLLRPYHGQPEFARLSQATARLVSITPEIQLAEPALDLRERARLRAEIDAIVAGLYDLSPAEFGYILTTFPLLDRDQPPLPDDFFVRWNKQGKPKLEPRSYVTRDTALLAYFRHRGIAPPDDLAVWYRDEVAVNMIDDEYCPFRMGPIRNLEQRVAEAHRRGAIAYIPSKAKKWDPNGPYQPLEDEAIVVPSLPQAGENAH